MARRSAPLVVAAVSAVLLVAVLAVDASMDRSYALEVRGEDGWRSFAHHTDAYPRGGMFGGPVVVSDNSSVEFRIRVDNGMPWAMSETYDVSVYGRHVADGAIEAPARGTGVSGFTLDVQNLTEQSRGPEFGAGGETLWFEVRVGDEYLTGEVIIQEARA